MVLKIEVPTKEKRIDSFKSSIWHSNWTYKSSQRLENGLNVFVASNLSWSFLFTFNERYAIFHDPKTFLFYFMNISFSVCKISDSNFNNLFNHWKKNDILQRQVVLSFELWTKFYFVTYVMALKYRRAIWLL